MKFLVSIKQVVDTSHIEVDPATGRIRRDGVKSLLNPCDRHALEAALSLRDEAGGTVTVITMGPPQAKEVLLEAVSMGADEVYLVTDRAFGGADTLATSYTLAKTVEKLGHFDMIFLGEASSDSTSAQVGPQLASMLGLPSVSAAVSLSLEEGKALVGRDMTASREIMEAALPLVVTVSPSMNKPRYPSITGIQKTWDAPIHELSAEDLGADKDRIGLPGSPTQVVRLRPVAIAKKENLRIEGKSADEAARLLTEALERIRVVEGVR